MTTKEIQSLKEKYEFDYDNIAVRTQDVPFSLGPISHTSHTLNPNFDLMEDLEGICATDIDSRMVSMHSDGKENNPDGYYFGSHCAIIGGNHIMMGDDEGEVIIQDPVVLEIIS